MNDSETKHKASESQRQIISEYSLRTPNSCAFATSLICATHVRVLYSDGECACTCTVCSQEKDKPYSRPVPVPGSADFRCPYISFSYDDRSSISSELPLRMNETSDVIIESLSRRPGHFRPLWFLLLGPRCLRSITNYGNPFLI